MSKRGEKRQSTVGKALDRTAAAAARGVRRVASDAAAAAIPNTGEARAKARVARGLATWLAVPCVAWVVALIVAPGDTPGSVSHRALALLYGLALLAPTFQSTHAVASARAQGEKRLTQRLVMDFLRDAATSRRGIVGGVVALALVGASLVGVLWAIVGVYAVTGYAAGILRLARKLATEHVRLSERLVGALQYAAGGTREQWDRARFTRGRGGVVGIQGAPPAAVGPIRSDLHAVNARFATVDADLEIVVDGTQIEVRPADRETIRQRELAAGSGGLVVHVAEPTNDGRRVVTLSEGVAESKADLVEAWGEQTFPGTALVRWDPARRAAVLAELSDEERQLRTVYSAQIGAPAHQVSVRIVRDGDGHRTVTVTSTAIAKRTQKARVELARELGVITPLEDPAVTRWAPDVAVDGMQIRLVEGIDPLAAPAPYPTDPADAPTLRSVPYARTEDGSTLRIGLIESNALIGGLPGSGKSGSATCLMRGFSQLEHVALIGFDPKLVELATWRPRFSAVILPDSPEDPEADPHAPATRALEALVQEMERRYAWLAERGLKKITPELVSAERPLLVVMIDELAELTAQGGSKDTIAGEKVRSVLLRRLVAKGRAAGISVFPMTQKPSSKVIDTDFRDLFAQRVAHATTNRDMSEMILGDGVAGDWGAPHEIAHSEKGVAYVISEGSRAPQRVRAFWVPDEDVAGHVDATAHLRVDLPWLDAALRQKAPATVVRGRAGAPVALGWTDVGPAEDLDLDLGELELPTVDFGQPDPDDPWLKAEAARAVAATPQVEPSPPTDADW